MTPASDSDWAEVLKYQETLHQLEISHWRDVIAIATALLKKVTRNGVWNFVMLRMCVTTVFIFPAGRDFD